MTEPTKALVAYGDRADVISLSKRIMSMHPAARSIGDKGALLLAQLGIALGLNPLPGTGHIHAWVDKSGNLLVHIGLEGRMAQARRDSPFSHSTRPMNPDEFELNGLRPGDKGSICELYRHDHTQMFAKLGIPVKPVIGIGVANSTETPPKGRTLYWRASQRAIKDAIRLAYSLSLPGDLLGEINFTEAVPDSVIEGEFSVNDNPVTATEETKQGTGETTETTVDETYRPDPAQIDRELAEAKAKRKAEAQSLFQEPV